MAAETVYSDDVPAVARQWQQGGATLIHVVDLNGAVDGEPRNFSQIEAIIRTVSLNIPPVMFVLRFTFYVSRVVMLTKRIIPCLDVKDGRVVKGVSFVNLRDAGDPVEVATVYDREGADELCFLDITASHENRKTIIDVVEQTAARVFMPLTVGGGVRTIEDIRALLNAGADKVSIGTPAAVQRPEFVKVSGGTIRDTMYRCGDRR